jgi:hypothetical protein
MLSYQQWRTLNESFGGALGVSTPGNLGLVSSFGERYDLDEKKSEKKSKKKMHSEDETGDGEMVDAASEKDEPEVDMEDGGCGEGEFCGKMSKKNMKKSAKKMWSDEDDAAEAPAAGEKGKKVPADLEGEEEDVDMDDDMGGCGEEGEEVATFSGKKSCKNSSKKSEKKSEKKMKAESTEEQDWWNSIKSMVNSNPNQKYGDGWSEYHEDALFAPAEPETTAQKEPGPGEVGFAPQQKLAGPGFFDGV